MFSKKKIVGVLLIPIVAGISYFSVKSYKERGITEIPVQRKTDYQVRLPMSAPIRPAKESFIGIKSGGRLDRILKKQGEEVKEGEILAIVDEASRRSQLKTALSRFELSQKNLGRVRRLYSQGAATRQELDDLVSDNSVRRADLEAAKEKFEDGILKAPHSGVLSVFAYSIGEIVPAGARMAIIENRDSYQLQITLPEKWKTKLSETVEVELDKTQPTVAGKVERPIPGAADAYVTIEKVPSEAAIGQVIPFTIIARTLKHAAWIPNQALYEIGTASQHLVVRGRDGVKYKLIPQIEEESAKEVLISNLPEEISVLSGVRESSKLPPWPVSETKSEAAFTS